MTFDEAFERLIGHEGGYVDHPSDPGGETNHGVTARVARAHGYQGDMRDLPLETAKAIARGEYWDAVKADALPAAVRFDVFDAAYNSGVTQASKWLQRAAGAADDGKIGPQTIAAANTFDGYRLLARFNGHRLQFFTDLGTWPQFGKGWSRRVANNLKEA